MAQQMAAEIAFFKSGELPPQWILVQSVAGHSVA